MSARKWIRCLAVPIAMIMIGCYLLGLRIYQNHAEYVTAPVSAAVPAPTETAAASAAIPDSEKININTASEQDLMKLQGIGKTLAKRIVERREQLGGFSVVEQLLEVKGIGEKLLQSIRDHITT